MRETVGVWLGIIIAGVCAGLAAASLGVKPGHAVEFGMSIGFLVFGLTLVAMAIISLTRDGER